MRKSDTCLRFGGDEFVGILPGVNRDLVPITIERIQQAVDEHKIILDGGRTVGMGISVGAATFPDDAKDLDLLLAIADQSMYRNKMTRTEQRYSAAVTPFDKGQRGQK
jgi:diguanylate cyclase (GGDEF)-like protein